MKVFFKLLYYFFKGLFLNIKAVFSKKQKAVNQSIKHTNNLKKELAKVRQKDYSKAKTFRHQREQFFKKHNVTLKPSKIDLLELSVLGDFVYRRAIRNQHKRYATTKGFNGIYNI